MNIQTLSVSGVQKILSAIAVLALVFSPFASLVPTAHAVAPTASANLSQAKNGGVGDPVISPVQWVSGAVNEQSGHYSEGESIPYQMVMSGLTPGQLSTLIIEFDVIKASGQKKKFAIDYITSNDRIAEVVDPCSDTAVCSGAPTDTGVIPAPVYTGSVNGYGAQDVLDSFNTLVANEGQQIMKLWNATFDSIAYTVSPDLTTDDSAQVTILFTPTETDAVLSWGGHISESIDYPGESAVSISGSPYHTRLISIDGKGGNQDMALSAGAVEYPGNLIVVKEVIGGTKTASDFTINVTTNTTASPSSFPGDANGTGVTIETPNNTDVTYEVTETPDAEYVATYSTDCTGTIASLEQKICTVTNTYTPPVASLTLVKEVDNSQGGTAVATDWTLTADGEGGNDISGAGGATGVVTPGDFTLSESTGPDRYSASGWSCNAGTLIGDVLTLVNGDDATCTITNTYVPPEKASITVVKTVNNDNGGTADTSSFQYFVDGTIEVFHNVAAMFDAVPAKQFTLSETSLPGYQSGDWGGDCAADGTVTLGEGESATCTITNDDIAPLLTVTKVVVNDSIGTSEVSDFTLTVGATEVTSGVQNEFNVGDYVVSESGPGGYSATYSGDCDANGNVSLALGDVKSCTITNNDIDPTDVTVNFNKIVNNNYGGTAVPSDFSFNVVGGNIDVTVPHGGSAQLPIGNYTVTENGPSGYTETFTGFCSGGTMTVVQDYLGETRTCTVRNNDIQPKLTVIKHVINDDPMENDIELTAGDFTITVDGTNVSSSSFAGDESGTVVTLDAGTFYVDEPNPGNYAVNFSGGCDGTIAIGEEKTCTITNNDLAPTMAYITVTKELTQEYGGTETYGDFAFILNGYNNNQPIPFESDGTNEIIVDSAGDYSISEVAYPGYFTEYAVSCDALSSVALGFSYNCKITNIELPECSDGIDNDNDGYIDFAQGDPGCKDGDDDDEKDPVGSITIDKVVTGENASGDEGFTFDLSWQNDDVVLSGNADPLVFTNLPSGTYTFAEINLPSRWKIVDIACYDTTNNEPEIIIPDADPNDGEISINLTINKLEGIVEDIVCTFTNEYTPRDSSSNTEHVVIKKTVTEGSDTDVQFSFDASWENDTILLGAGMQNSSPDLIAEDTYSVYEFDLPLGWSLASTSCPTSFELADGETRECEFVNDQERYIIEGYVWHDEDEDGIFDQDEEPLPGWTVFATNGTKNYSRVTDGSGYYSFNVPRGTWSLTEQVQRDWNQTFPSTNNDGVHVVTVPAEEPEQEEFFTQLFNLFVPTAHAAIVGTFGLYNFGNVQDGGGSTGTRVTRGGGGGGGSSTPTPQPEVLGAATEDLPVGAPDTGRGGALPSLPHTSTTFAIVGIGRGVRKSK